MTKEEAIKYLKQLYPQGGHCWLDEQRIEAIGMAVDALKEHPASEDLEEEIRKYQKEVYDRDTTVRDVARHFADWQKQQLFKLKEGVKPWSEEDEDNFEDEFAKTLAEKKGDTPKRRGKIFRHGFISCRFAFLWMEEATDDKRCCGRRDSFCKYTLRSDVYSKIGNIE